YKLSLYHSMGEQASVPVAKLLSQKERPVATAHLERLAAAAEPSTVSLQTIDSGGFGALLISALLALSFSFLCVLTPEETPPLSAPVVSRVGPRAPPSFA